MKYFDFERLEVYQTSLDYLILIEQLIRSLPKGNFHLCDQLYRASTSITLNIAEGAGEYAPKEKARFYRMAKRSATESASVLEILQKLKLTEEKTYNKGREYLIRVVSMLTRMIKSRE